MRPWAGGGGDGPPGDVLEERRHLPFQVLDASAIEGIRGLAGYWKRGGGEGEGVWNPKSCVPKIAQINISSFINKFPFSHHEIWVQRGGWEGVQRRAGLGGGPEGGLGGGGSRGGVHPLLLRTTAGTGTSCHCTGPELQDVVVTALRLHTGLRRHKVLHPATATRCWCLRMMLLTSTALVRRNTMLAQQAAAALCCCVGVQRCVSLR